MNALRSVASIAALFCAANPLHAQQSGQYVEQAGPYTIHYSMVPTTLLPDVVKRRHLLPDSGAALLNVAVRREGLNLPADISTRVSNLVGQPLDIEMRRVEENGLVSYLGVVDISNVEAFHVTMTIVPVGSTQPIEIEFEENYRWRRGPAWPRPTTSRESAPAVYSRLDLDADATLTRAEYRGFADAWRRRARTFGDDPR